MAQKNQYTIERFKMKLKLQSDYNLPLPFVMPNRADVLGFFCPFPFHKYGGTNN